MNRRRATYQAKPLDTAIVEIILVLLGSTLIALAVAAFVWIGVWGVAR